MTFEEFIADFAQFVKIDTAEKLEFCRQQYEWYLLNQEDVQYFHPWEKTDSVYKNLLEEKLTVNNIEEGQVGFFMIPSFDSEGLMIIDSKSGEVIYKEFASSLWYSEWRNDIDASPQIVIHKSKLPEVAVNKICQLTESLIKKARPKRANTHVLDGTTYRLIMRKNGELLQVIKISPDENSKPGRVIAIFKEIINFTQHNLDYTETIESKIDELL